MNSTLTDSSERTWAGSVHVAALVTAALTVWAAGVAGAVAAAIVWFLVKDRSAFAARHAKEALNFNVTMLILTVIGLVIGAVLLGGTLLTLGLGAIVTLPLGLALLLAWLAIGVLWLVCSILAAIKGFAGEEFRYPLSIRIF